MMPDDASAPALHLIVGDKNYSSWSMRPWVALRAAGIPFRETTIELDTPASKAAMLRHSPAGRVPVLEHGDLVVWDSLAICEYAAELFPDRGMWPTAVPDRALARSLCAEMHSGFQALRSEMPLNIRRRRARTTPPSAHAHDDLQRVKAIFAGARRPFLFGAFGIADAFYAPVATRLVTYEVALGGPAEEYVSRVLAHDAVRAWVAAAERETHALPSYDALA